MVIKEESAEAIVACKKRRAEHELGEGTDELLVIELLSIQIWQNSLIQ